MADKKVRRILDQVNESTSIIGEGLRFSGQLIGRGNLIASGEVESDCDIDGPVTLTAGGRWVGRIKAQDVIIAGSLSGEVIAEGKIEVASTARVEGNLAGGRIAIAQGAVVDGSIAVGDGDGVHHFAEKRGRPENR